MSFWDIIWFIFVAYVFFAYLMVLFSVSATSSAIDRPAGSPRRCGSFYSSSCRSLP